MAELARQARALAVVPLLIVAVGLPTWWFVRAGTSDPPPAGVPEQQPVPEVQLSPEVDRAIAALPERFESVPVINYHDLSERDSPYAMPPPLFAEHMAALDAAGVTTIGIEQLQAHLVDGADLPDRPVLVTFDDGVTSIYEWADPILADHGFRAVSFLITSTTSPAERSYHLNAATLERMAASGRWDFGAHTHDQHRLVQTADEPAPALLNLESGEDGTVESFEAWQERVRSDLARNVELVEQFTGDRPIAFAYPFSAHDRPTNAAQIPAALAAMVDEQFELAFTASTTRPPGVERDIDRSSPLPRLSVQDDLSAAEMIQRLAAMSPPQLPPQLDAATWEARGPGHCGVADGVIAVDATDYTSCRSSGHRQLPRSFELNVRVTGNDRRSTAIVGVESESGNVEVAVGESRSELRRRTDGDWEVVAEVRSAVGEDGSVPVSIVVHGDAVSATVAGEQMRTSCEGCSRFSTVVLSVATRDRGLFFVDPRLDAR